MKTFTILTTSFIALSSMSIFAQSPSPAPAPAGAGAPSAEQMQQMMELSKLNDNHKLLTSLNGTWNYTVKFWMDGNTASKPQESKGSAIRKSMMDGRFVEMDVNGKMEMPGPDGKMQAMLFKGKGIEGYDNVKKKFTGLWMDNMGTGMMMAEGDYDPATKTFTYTGQMTPMPGMTIPIKELVKVPDKNHMMLEWYESRGGQETKTMEIDYTRAGTH